MENKVFGLKRKRVGNWEYKEAVEDGEMGR